MTKRLIILQNKEDCRYYEYFLFNKNDKFLPIGPHALYYCDLKNLETISFEDLGTLEEHNYERQKADDKVYTIIEKLNLFSKNKYKNRNIEIGNYFGFQLQFIIGVVLHNAYLSKKIYGSYKDFHIVAFQFSENVPFLKFRPYPHSLLSRIFFNIYNNKKKNLELHTIVRHKSLKSFKSILYDNLPDRALHLLRKIRDKISIYSINSLFTSKMNLALVGGLYEWKNWIMDKEIEKEFKIHPIRKFIPEKKSIHTNEILNIINENIEFPESYDFKDLSNMIGAYLEYFYQNKSRFKKSLRKFDAIISSVMCDPEEHFIAHISQELKKPVIIWQHGEKGSYQDTIELYTEFMYTSHYLSYGKAVTESLSQRIGKRYLTNIESVGTIQKNIYWRGKGSKIITYCTGKWLLTINGFNAFQDPDKRLYKIQKSIMNYLNKLDDWHVLVKGNNTGELNEIPYQKDYRNINFHFNTNFINLLGKSEIVILDTPATTLVEACSTEIPIFFIEGRNLYTETFKKNIKKRVTWCEDETALLQKLQLYIDTNVYEGNVKDKSYKNLFVYNNHSKKPKDSVSEYLKKII